MIIKPTLRPGKYKHILFDLDHTLWDFEVNSREMISELYVSYDLQGKCNVSCDEICVAYSQVNQKMWQAFNVGKIDKDELRDQRFYQLLLEFGVDDKMFATQLSDEYIEKCPTKKAVFPAAEETLAFLSKKYKLHIISNGFQQTTLTKVASSGLLDFFQTITSSECSGYKKPDKAIFQYVLKLIDSSHDECVMIGDNYTTDILGAKNAGIDHIYFNPEKQKHRLDVMHEIYHLTELKTIF